METKPKIDFSKTKSEIQDNCRIRLNVGNRFHNRNEQVVCSLLNMMLEKTQMYGGDDNTIPLDEKILRSYYSGISRKSNRLPEIIKNSTKENDKSAKIELVDTILDLAGYCIIALSAFAEEIQNE